MRGDLVIDQSLRDQLLTLTKVGPAAGQQLQLDNRLTTVKPREFLRVWYGGLNGQARPK